MVAERLQELRDTLLEAQNLLSQVRWQSQVVDVAGQLLRFAGEPGFRVTHTWVCPACSQCVLLDHISQTRLCCMTPGQKL